MTLRPCPVKWRVPLVLSGFLCFGALFPCPSPVRDAVTEQFAAGYHWHFPWTYVLFAPFCSAADMLTVLSLKQMMVFLFYCALALSAAPIRLFSKGKVLVLFLGFLGMGGFYPPAHGEDGFRRRGYPAD